MDFFRKRFSGKIVVNKNEKLQLCKCKEGKFFVAFFLITNIVHKIRKKSTLDIINVTVIFYFLFLFLFVRH